MKPQAARDLSVEELHGKEKELQEQLFRLRFQKSIGQLDNAMKIRDTRRDIARVKSVLRERSQGAAGASARSRSTDFTRAMSRRVSRIFMALSSWPIDFWKRRRKSCSCSSRSLPRSSSPLISLIFSGFTDPPPRRRA